MTTFIRPASLIHISNSQVSSQASSPGFLLRRQDRLHSSFFRRSPERTEGARDRWTRGPRRLATSRHVEVRVSRLRSIRAPTRNRKSARSEGVPRAVFVGLLQHRPRWSTVRHVSAKPRDSPPYETRALSRRSSDRGSGLLTGDPPYRRSGASAAARMPGRARLGPPGASVASPTPPSPATAPRPASGDADQTPLGNGGGIRCE